MVRRRPSRPLALVLAVSATLVLSGAGAAAAPGDGDERAADTSASVDTAGPAAPAIGPLAPPAAPSGTGQRCVPVLEETVAGEDAVEALGADLPAVARGHGRTARELRAALAADDQLHVDPCGSLFFVDERHEHDEHHEHGLGEDGDAPDAAAGGSSGAASGVLAAEPPAPLARTFELHSRPGSKRTIYLDFVGSTLTGTAWNGAVTQPGLPEVPGSLVLPPYSLDEDPAFSAVERATIQAIWQHVAEDFAPFDVNVTTEDPGAEAITRSDSSDEVFGTRAAITNLGLGVFCTGCSGIAFVGVFAASRHHAVTQPALVFTEGMWGAHGVPQVVADTISHEVGHNLGLLHHTDERNDDYSRGQGIWGPIMGSSSRPLGTWSNGDYRGALNVTQDDVATIAKSGAPLAADDHGATRAAATVLGRDELTASGVIATRTDQDWFRFEAAGPTTVAAAPAPVGPNLHIGLQLVDADGAVLATGGGPSSWQSWPPGQPVLGLDATVTRDLRPGTYYARVTGRGSGEPLVDGYSDYGSLGRYTLTLTTGPLPEPAPAPVVTITSAPSGATASSSASVAFAADVAGASFTCRLDGGAWQPCTSPWQRTGLAEGARTFAVRATAAGRTSETVSRTWTVDTIAPTVTITGAPAAGATSAPRTTSFTLTASEAGVTYRCRLGTTESWRACSSPVSHTGLTTGSYTFQVRATDPAGNTGPTASRSWTFAAPTRPSPVADPPPPSPVAPRFDDVSSASAHAVNIAKLAGRGVTLGCGGTRFCPDQPVSREQMATFLTRALDLDAGAASPPFSDVVGGSTHARSIDAMRREAITLGCGGGRFCPTAAVPRDQMASFLQRALPLDPGSSAPPFADVGAGSTHARSIDAVRRAGITLGCGSGRYCPADPVTRAQMASFLVRALGW